MMETIEEQIDVECPVRAVYNQWTKFDELPYFMSGVTEVVQHDTLVWWRGEVWGRDIEWESEITVQEPDECICWRSTSGHGATGEVRFESLGANRTRVYLAMTYETDGPMDSLSEDSETMRSHVYYTLEDFKHFIEQREPDMAEWPTEAYMDHAPARARGSLGTLNR
jgi:uncharacterized membrane protein